MTKSRKKQRSDSPPIRLGDLQLSIMQVLWNRGPSSIADVQASLGGTRLAYTTIATMLHKMEERGLVRHKEDGRRFIFEPAVSNQEVVDGAATHLIDRLFEGSLTKAVNHLLQVRDVDPTELDALDALIRQRRKQQ